MPQNEHESVNVGNDADPAEIQVLNQSEVVGVGCQKPGTVFQQSALLRWSHTLILAQRRAKRSARTRTRICLSTKYAPYYVWSLAAPSSGPRRAFLRAGKTVGSQTDLLPTSNFCLRALADSSGNSACWTSVIILGCTAYLFVVSMPAVVAFSERLKSKAVKKAIVHPTHLNLHTSEKKVTDSRAVRVFSGTEMTDLSQLQA